MRKNPRRPGLSDDSARRILTLVALGGPEDVLGESIARATGRKFVDVARRRHPRGDSWP